ncbi:MAG: prolipoprotein diacylglyceryl transferase, partial [Firmicutes bacterium]|nr:prolipoprotein diacylglyceryl transferase [Bacillota bacterium]
VLYERKQGRSKFGGQIFCLYAFFYSLERFFVEGLRTDSLWIGPFRQAQIISVCTMVIAATAYFVLKKRAEKKALKAAEAAAEADDAETSDNVRELPEETDKTAAEETDKTAAGETAANTGADEKQAEEPGAENTVKPEEADTFKSTQEASAEETQAPAAESPKDPE